MHGWVRVVTPLGTARYRYVLHIQGLYYGEPPLAPRAWLGASRYTFGYRSVSLRYAGTRIVFGFGGMLPLSLCARLGANRYTLVYRSFCIRS